MSMNADTKEMLWLLDGFLDEHTVDLAARELVWMSEARGLLAQAHNSILKREDFQ